MEDFDFDKQFADKMRQTSAPDFSDDDWARLSPVLSAQLERRRRILPLWWLGALSGLLLGSNIAWWWMWQNMDKRTEALRTEFQQIKAEPPHRMDTTHTKVIVYQYDTVYRTIVYQLEPAQRAGGEANSLSSGLTVAPNKPFGDEIGTQASAPEVGVLQPDTVTHISENLSSDCLPVPIDPLALPYRAYKAPDQDLVMVPLRHSRAKKNLVLIPRKFRAGAGMAWVLPQSSALTAKMGYSMGVAGEIAFSDQLALTLEGAYTQIQFKGNQYDEKLGLPPEKKPSDDYVLKYFEPDESLKSIIQGTIGMRYWARSSRRLSPYLGFGYALQWHPAFELQVEYHDPVQDKEKEISLEVPALASPVALLDFNAGLRYRFMPGLSWQTGIDYLYKPDADKPGISQFWGLKSFVLYTF